MVGITRIKIVSNWNDWRVRMADDLAPAANALYRAIFQSLGMPLLPGEEIVTCTKQEAFSRYDWSEGIDVILRTQRGTRMTLQEKFLDYTEWTVTFEEVKTSGEPGAWYYCTAQYYFVGYATEYKTKQVCQFQAWMLTDLAALHRCDEAGKIQWGSAFTRTPDNPLGLRRNGRDGRLSSFRFVPFAFIPPSCVIAAKFGRIDTLRDEKQPYLFGVR